MPISRTPRKSVNVSFFSFQDMMTSVVGIFILIIMIMVLQLADSVAKSQKSSGAISQEFLDFLVFLEQEVTRLQSRYEELQKEQSISADVSLFNKDQRTAQLQSQLEDLNNRIAISSSQIRDLSRSLIEAKQMHEAALSDSVAAESDRQEIERVLTERERIEKISAILETDHPLVFRDQTAEGKFLVLVRLEEDKVYVADSGGPSTKVFTGLSRHRQLKAWLKDQSLGNRQFFMIVKPSGAGDYEAVAQALESSGALYGFDIAGEQSNFVLRSQLERGI